MAHSGEAWELENAAKLVDPTRDALYVYSTEESSKINAAKPWRQDPHHFKHVRISAMALVKMTMHARSGGDIEVMGLMLGYVQHETFIVTDALRLPVEGTETRVNAQSDADEYMVKFLERSRQAGQLENAVGWYHSHPGYGCWLSGIDVGTQQSQQSYMDPFVAVVIDPHRTLGTSKVEIGAFRTYPEGYQAADQDSVVEGTAAVPSAKAADFGAHASKYYSLEVSHYKSTLDTKILGALGDSFWVQTLSAVPLQMNQDYITRQVEDLAFKTKQVHDSVRSRPGFQLTGPRKTKGDEPIAKVVKAAEKITHEEKMNLMATTVKEVLFGSNGASNPATASGNGADTDMANLTSALVNRTDTEMTEGTLLTTNTRPSSPPARSINGEDTEMTAVFASSASGTGTNANPVNGADTEMTG